jgi:hypothetical protein
MFDRPTYCSKRNPSQARISNPPIVGKILYYGVGEQLFRQALTTEGALATSLISALAYSLFT